MTRSARLPLYRLAMPDLTLLTGSPAIGKIDALRKGMSERYRAGSFAENIVLVPTVRHGDQLRWRLVERCR